MTDQNDLVGLICCAFMEGDRVQPISVEIARDVAIVHLIRSIIHGYGKSGIWDASKVDLYRVDYTKDEFEKIVVPPPERLLGRLDDVGDHWTIPGKQLIHILAHVKVTRPRIPEPDDTGEALPGLFKGLELRQDTIARRYREGKAASQVAVHSEFAKQQNDSTIALCNGRPFGCTGLPIQLYHPAFDTFTKSLEATQELSAAKYAAVEELMHASQAFYSDDSDRWRRLGPVFITALSSQIDTDPVSKCQSDGVVKFVDTDTALSAYCAIIKVANEVGTMRSFDTGGRVLCNLLESRNGVSCSSPMLLPILDHRPRRALDVHIRRSLSGKVVVQPLTDYIWLGHHPQQDYRLAYLARLFDAASTSINELQGYYQSIFTMLPRRSSVDPFRFFPHVRQYLDASGKIINFEYSGPVDDSSILRPAFVASTQFGEKIVIKFVQRYSLEAHKMLAAKNLAPSLLFYEPEPLHGGLRMLVMEHIPCVTLDQFPSRHGTRSNSELEGVRGEVQEALECLHNYDLVFGDLRAPNILVVEKNGAKARAMLVDFDWCGKETVARYPVSMNQSGSIWWPEGAKKGGLMLKRHDNELFRNIFGE